MSDIPIDPTTGQPDHHAEVVEAKSWLRQNAVSLLITAGVVGFVLWKLDPLDVVKVILGLGFIILIHELGHFLAAKWCDVHVKTFSIGFGPAVPFCSYKWGETTYMIGIIPLGGYVSMVGEGTGESTPDGDPDDDDNDPRSFKNKPVGSRMLIISAGVVMNLLLGIACFMAAYLHGVAEKPASVGLVESGGAAWRAGIRTGDDVTRIGGRDNPFFDDLPPIVMSTLKDEQLPITTRRGGKLEERTVEPIRDEVSPVPQLGVSPPFRLVLGDSKRKAAPAAYAGTPAGLAVPGFERGDRLVAMTDPADPTRVTPFATDPNNPSAAFDDYYRRAVDLAAKPVTVHVLRKGQPDGAAPAVVTVGPALRHDLGVRFQMGKVAAVRRGSSADGHVTAAPLGSPASPGDVIAAVGVTDPDGKRTWFANGPTPPEAGKGDAVRPLDPLLLPHQLSDWAASYPGAKRGDLTATLVVLREDGADHRARRLPLALRYDDSFRYDRETVTQPNSPLPLSGLGVAYWVEAVAADVEAGKPAAGQLQAGDVVVAVRLKSVDGDGTVAAGEWRDIKPHQWAAVDAAFQSSPPHEIDLRIRRGDETREVTLRGVPDPARGLPDRGFRFDYEVRTQTADGAGDALRLGWYRTGRFVKTVYQNLYGMIAGRISPKTLSGPLTIATVSYKFAGEDFWQLLLFIGMISVNLAVVNFLPIPVLDGGHMVFLLYEKATGRPVPERLFAALMWGGLVMILGLFVFVMWNDIVRLFF